MNWVGLAATVAAIGTVITSIAGLVLAVKTTQTHKIVNSQRTAMVAYTKTLSDAMRAAGIAVPDDPSVE